MHFNRDFFVIADHENYSYPETIKVNTLESFKMTGSDECSRIRVQPHRKIFTAIESRIFS